MSTSQPTPTTDESQEKDLTHDWVGAALVQLDDKTAKRADLRGSYRTKEEEKIDVLDVYCRECKRPYTDVALEPCSAKVDNTHLIGGDPGVRAKRKVYVRPANGVPMPGPRISRRGVDAIVNGGGINRPW